MFPCCSHLIHVHSLHLRRGLFGRALTPLRRLIHARRQQPFQWGEFTGSATEMAAHLGEIESDGSRLLLLAQNVLARIRQYGCGMRG